MCSRQCRSRARLGRLAYRGRVDQQRYREMPARALDEGIPVVGKYALHRRTKVARVLTS
jgi:molybdopterin/thiamine biosynthesis adenylyltransferase